MKKSELGPLHVAVMKHSLPEVIQALARGSTVDELDREGRTPLWYAAGDKDVSIMSELLRHGANPNALDKRMWSPLHFAAQENRVEAA